MNKEKFSNIQKLNITYFKHLDLVLYKTRKCLNKIKHNHTICNFYHNKKDKRRNILKYDYQIKLCRNYNNCFKKNNCNFSHNKIEIWYHFDFYKKKYCLEFLKKKKCNYKDNCSFVHYDYELRIKSLHFLIQDRDFFMFHYKTEFCPLGNIFHDKINCIYAHNYQDYKRKNINYLKPIKCNFWKNNVNYKIYNKGCKRGIKCIFCHGKNELLFHPKSNLVNEFYKLNNYNFHNFSLVIKNRS